MAKKKSGKKFSSSSENPFNIKVNRNKHSIIGQKMKGTRGVPGVSHSMGNAKRKEIFHKKRIQSQKANKFLDKRLLTNSLNYEDQATARLVQERKKKLKKSIFNLNDEESLTHKGVPLLSDNSLNDQIIDSEDEEQLDTKFVKQAHFGGFFEDSKTDPKSRKDIIDELIIESKKRKQERKLAKEINTDLIEKLDKEWKERHNAMPLMKIGKEKELPDKNDPFDVILQELKFEMRATPSSRLKSPEEIEREEREKLKKLEEERNKRMMNPMDIIKDKDNQLSADSIYDGLDIQFEPIDDQDIDKTNEEANEKSDDESDDNSSDDSEDENDLNNSFKKDTELAPIVCDDDEVSEIPVSLDAFYNIVDSHREELYVLIDTILKGVIKNKTKENLEKLKSFFAILIEYTMKARDGSSKSLDELNCIMPHFYTLAEISPEDTAHKFLMFLDEEQEIFQSSKGKKLKNNFPRFQCLVLFKISSILYSVSDFKHPVVTPAILFMCDILSSAYAVSFENTFSRLFICRIMYNCVSYSKRYVPEVLWFLNKSLKLTMDNSKKFNLVLNQAIPEATKIDLNFNMNEQTADVTKASILSEIFEILHHFSLLYVELPSYQEIFSDALKVCSRLPIINYPNFLKEAISKFTSTVESIKKTYIPLKFENQKPVPLKLFEPAFDSKFTRKKDDLRKKRKLIKNVGQKIRKEEKGMLREMRRDNQVIASEKLKEKLEEDAERKRKVKMLYSELAMQEGEYKKFVKKK